MRTEQELEEFYRTELASLGECFIRKKKEAFRNAWIAAAAASVLAVIAALFLLNSDDPPSLAVLIGCGAAFAVIMWLVVLFASLGERDKLFKQEVVSRVVNFCDPGLKYQPYRSLPQSVYFDSGIFQHRLNKYEGEDLVKGLYSGVALQFSELHTQYKETHRTKNGTTTTWHTVFKGLFFAADFNKHFHAYTLVVPDTAEKLFGSVIGNFFQKMNAGRQGQLIKLENPVFEKQFAVYGTDPVEARYILTPKLMERILALREYYHRDISLAFHNSNVYLAVSDTDNLFEYHGSALEWKDVLGVYRELMSILQIVETLDLTLRIWTKE